jgi:glycosyltransferase involved in cell wall biosynthesis
VLSVVITTFNRADCIDKNLDEFYNQTDMDFEVVVAVDGSTDNTIDVLEEHKKMAPFPLKWIDTGETDKFCMGKARNMGVLETVGEAVVILDDDSFPCPEFIAEHKRTVRKKTLTGGYREADEPKLKAKMKALKGFTIGKFQPNTVENNTCMFRKDWISCGLFTERIESYGGVGQEFIKRLISQGYEYQFNPKAKIYHRIEMEGNNGITRDDKNKQCKKSVKILKKF